MEMLKILRFKSEKSGSDKFWQATEDPKAKLSTTNLLHFLLTYFYGNNFQDHIAFSSYSFIL